MPERRDPNRIEVELRILQQRELDRLTNFSRDFDASVSRLAGFMGGPQAETSGARMQRAAAGQSAPSSGISAGASVAPINQAGLVGPQEQIPSGGTSKDTFSQKWAKDFFNNPVWGGFTPPGLEDRISGSPWASRIAASAGVAFAAPHVMSRLPGIANVGAGFGQMLGAPQMTGFGQEIGLSRSGILGTPINSPAFRAGLSSSYRAATRSWFGFNPNYSMAQSQRLESTMNQLGLTNMGGADQVRNMMQRLEQNTGVSPELQAPFLEQSLRFGTNNIDQMAGAIENLSAVAAASGRNVQSLAQEIANVALSTAQQTGGNVGRTLMGTEALVQGTGMSPETAGGIMGNTLFGYMAVARDPRHPYSAMTSAGGRFQAAQAMATGIIGMSPSRLAELKRSDPALWEQKMFTLQQIYMRNPDMLGGMTPDEVMGTSAGGATGRVRGAEMVLHGQISAGLRTAGLGGRVDEIMALDPDKRRKAASDMISEISKNARENQRNKIMVALTPDARKLLTLMGDDDASHRNKWRSRADRAIDIGGDIKDISGMIPGTPW